MIVPEALVSETVKQLTSLDQKSLLFIIEHCLKNPTSKPVIFQGIRRLNRQQQQQQGVVAVTLSERVRLLDFLDLNSISLFMNEAHQAVASISENVWNDTWEDRIRLVEKICNKLKPYLIASQQLTLKYKSDFEHVFQFYDLLLSKIEKMSKIEMRGSLLDDFSHFEWKDIKGNPGAQKGFINYVLYCWYLALKELKDMEQQQQQQNSSNADSSDSGSGDNFKMNSELVNIWMEQALLYDTHDLLTNFLKSDGDWEQDDSVFKLLIKKRVSIFLKKPSLQSYDTTIESCSSDEEKVQVSDELICQLGLRIRDHADKILLLQLYARTNRDVVALCDKFETNKYSPMDWSFDIWGHKDEEKSQRFMITCEGVINTNPEYVFQTAKKFLFKNRFVTCWTT